MPLLIVRNDITAMKVDAIVNAANETLLGGGGVDGAIHRAAGPKLLEECRKLKGCRTGEAKITKGYQLPAKYIIHTVGPVWQGGDFHERELLVSCYENSLKLAEKHHCGSIAFPVISAGVYGYPKEEALKAATETISRFLLNHEMTVYIVIYNKKMMTIGQKLFDDIQEFIDDCYAADHSDEEVRIRQRMERAGTTLKERTEFESPDSTIHPDRAVQPEIQQDGTIQPERVPEPPVQFETAKAEAKRIPGLFGNQRKAAPSSLDEALDLMDESFSQMLLRKIDERGMKDSECYKKANIDRKLFSKIRKDVHYKPSKPTAIAFAIALELSAEETDEMLLKAGFALSRSSKFDIIIQYFIQNHNYNIFEINEALFAFDQPLLG